jgi:chaperonin cofactor prefoldin
MLNFNLSSLKIPLEYKTVLLNDSSFCELQAATIEKLINEKNTHFINLINSSFENAQKLKECQTIAEDSKVYQISNKTFIKYCNNLHHLYMRYQNRPTRIN